MAVKHKQSRFSPPPPPLKGNREKNYIEAIFRICVCLILNLWAPILKHILNYINFNVINGQDFMFLTVDLLDFNIQSIHFFHIP